MSEFTLSPAIPQLVSGNVEETARFFEKFLGFEVVSLMKEHKFLMVKRGAAEIHFWQADTPEEARAIASSSSCYIRVKNIGALFKELKSRDVKFRYELKVMPW